MGLLKSIFGSSPDGKFGTFAGVFTPSILTILGVIMYLRFGWVVGQAGLAGTLIIVAVAHTITIATGLSISAIATNQTVKTGGAYFMISRSLGLELGGAIGIPLFLGQALSVSLYIMGFTESFHQLLPGVPPRIISSIVCVGLTALSLWSADIAIKTQYVVMVAIGLSLVSFGLGSSDGGGGAIDWWPRTVDGQAAVPFATVFAVFFPAVTGITAGISMSGDLRDPRRAIPRGTLAAIFVGMVVYTVIPVLLILKADTGSLRTDMLIMQHVSLVPALILAGITWSVWHDLQDVSPAPGVSGTAPSSPRVTRKTPIRHAGAGRTAADPASSLRVSLHMEREKVAAAELPELAVELRNTSSAPLFVSLDSVVLRKYDYVQTGKNIPVVCKTSEVIPWRMRAESGAADALCIKPGRARTLRWFRWWSGRLCKKRW